MMGSSRLVDVVCVMASVECVVPETHGASIRSFAPDKNYWKPPKVLRR